MPLILNHPSFLTPEKEDKLWRYMEFAKFVSMITSKALWFSNAEVLARDDPFEGTLPKASFDHRQWKKGEDPFPAYFKAFGIDPESDVARLMRGTPPELRVVTQEQMVRFIYAQRRAYFLNCWHKSQIESAAMWKTYGKHDDAIAVTSSVAKMEYAFREVAAQIYCGSVEYIDFDSDHVRLDSIFNAILRKRKSFGYENEVRLLSFSKNSKEKVEPRDRLSQPGVQDVVAGRLIECNLLELVDEIWISPTSPKWLAGTVEEFCKVIGFKARIKRSTLLDGPYR